MNTTMLTLTTPVMNDVESGISVASACAALVRAPRVRRPLGMDAWSESATVRIEKFDHDKSTCVSVPGCRGVT